MEPVERAELLERAERLNKERDYPEVCRLLEILPGSGFRSEPSLAYYLAVAWRQTGKEKKSRELLCEIERFVPLQGNDSLLRRIYNLQGMLSIEFGNLNEADSYFSAALESADQAGDHLIAGLVVAHQGILADIRCDWTKALVCYHRSKGHWQIVRDFLYIGLCNHNLGMTYRQLALLDQADASFRDAMRMFRRYGRPDDVCATEIERALLFSLRGESILANKTISRALARAHRMEDKKLEGEALRVQGLIELHETNYQGARVSLRLAARIARDLGIKMLRAEAQEALALIDRITGHSRSAVRRERLSKSLYLQMGAAVRAGSVGGDAVLPSRLKKTGMVRNISVMQLR